MATWQYGNMTALLYVVGVVYYNDDVRRSVVQPFVSTVARPLPTYFLIHRIWLPATPGVSMPLLRRPVTNCW